MGASPYICAHRTYNRAHQFRRGSFVAGAVAERLWRRCERPVAQTWRSALVVSVCFVVHGFGARFRMLSCSQLLSPTFLLLLFVSLPPSPPPRSFGNFTSVDSGPELHSVRSNAAPGADPTSPRKSFLA